MAYMPRFTTAQRDALYSREQLAAHKAGRGPHPICVHCDLPVTPGQDWDESHVDVPKALGGKSTGVGHRACNQRDNNEVVTPMVARCDRKRRRHLGIDGPGLGRFPMAGGRRSAITKTMRHGVQPRMTQSQKHACTLAARAIAIIAPVADDQPVTETP